MATYIINGNSMHRSGSQEDVSDEFFGSDSPRNYATQQQRLSAVYHWVNENMLQLGDIVEWAGRGYRIVSIVVGGGRKAVEVI